MSKRQLISTTKIDEMRARPIVLGDKAKALITVEEVASHFRCGVSTVWRWAKEGKIPQPIRIGGLTRWKLDEFQACIAAAEAQRDTTH